MGVWVGEVLPSLQSPARTGSMLFQAKLFFYDGCGPGSRMSSDGRILVPISHVVCVEKVGGGGCCWC